MADKKVPAGKTQDDSVAGQQRFRDSVKQELRFMQMYEKRRDGAPKFVLNPATIQPVEPKVGYVSARKQSPEETASFMKDVDDLKETLARSNRLPQEKVSGGVHGIGERESDEIGWYHAHYYNQVAKPFKVATHKLSDEVEFAKTYAKLMKTMPFAKNQ